MRCDDKFFCGGAAGFDGRHHLFTGAERARAAASWDRFANFCTPVDSAHSLSLPISTQIHLCPTFFSPYFPFLPSIPGRPFHSLCLSAFTPTIRSCIHVALIVPDYSSFLSPSFCAVSAFPSPLPYIPLSSLSIPLSLSSVSLLLSPPLSSSLLLSPSLSPSLYLSTSSPLPHSPSLSLTSSPSHSLLLPIPLAVLHYPLPPLCNSPSLFLYIYVLPPPLFSPSFTDRWNCLSNIPSFPVCFSHSSFFFSSPVRGPTCLSFTCFPLSVQLMPV